MIKAEWKRIADIQIIQIICSLFVLFCLGQVFYIPHDYAIKNNRITVFEKEKREEYNEQYETVLNQNIKDLQDKQSSILFSGEDKQRIIKKELDQYEKLKVIPFVPIDDIAVSELTGSLWMTSSFLILVGFILFYFIFFQDDESHLFDLYNTTAKKTESRTLGKLVVLFSVLFLLWLVSFASVSMIFLLLKISPNLPVQFMYGMNQFKADYSVFTYVFTLSINGFLSCLFILALLIFLNACAIPFNYSLMLLTVLMIVEYILSSFISIASPLRILKEVNLYTFLFSKNIANRYICIFHHVFHAHDFYLMWCFFLLLVLCIFICFAYGHNHFKKSHINTQKYVLKLRRIRSFHLKNVMITHHGLLIITSLFVFLLVNAIRFQNIQSDSEKRFEEFRSQYYGPINERLITRINDDKKEIFEAENLKMEFLDKGELTETESYQLQELIKKSLDKDNILKVEEEVNELYLQGAKRYQNFDGVKYLVQKDDKNGMLYSFLLFTVPSCILVIYVIHTLKKTRMLQLISTTKKGEKYALSSYKKIFLFVGFILFCIVYSFHAWKISRGYPLEWSTDVYAALSLNVNIPSWFYFFLFYLNRWMIGAFLIQLSIIFARKMSLAGAIVLLGSTVFLFCILPFTKMMLSYDFINQPITYVIYLCIVVICNNLMYFNLKSAFPPLLCKREF